MRMDGDRREQQLEAQTSFSSSGSSHDSTLHESAGRCARAGTKSEIFELKTRSISITVL